MNFKSSQSDLGDASSPAQRNPNVLPVDVGVAADGQICVLENDNVGNNEQSASGPSGSAGTVASGVQPAAGIVPSTKRR